MFTGLIEEIGLIQKITPVSGGGKQIKIQAKKILSDLEIDNSVAVSGVCLTVVKIFEDEFVVEAVGETLEKSTLRNTTIGQRVNLERALRLSDRLGGHFVQGHVNGMGTIKQILQRGENWYLEIEIPIALENYVIDEGSIAIDGVSLTIANLKRAIIGISVIPYTFKNTIINDYQINQKVNIETDFLAKYVENFIQAYGKSANSKITIDNLKNMGF